MLADSFLEDLEGLGEDSEPELEESQSSEGEAPEGEEASAVAVEEDLYISTLRSKVSYRAHMLRVEEAMSRPVEDVKGVLEDDPDYQLVVECNRLIHEIEEQINISHRFVAVIYSKKFPELDSILTNKVDYVKTVQRIGNEMDLTAIELNDILPSALVMIVSVTGSTTNGKQLSEDDLATCLRGCAEIRALEDDKMRILRFVESRMTKIAPNTCEIIGTFLAAQLVGLAGGLISLSQVPADNFQVIGQEKRNLAGFSRVASMPNTGILYYADLVQRCPPMLRKKALKVLGHKVALVVRCDAYKNHPDGSEGRQLKDELVEKFEKWNEPQKARTKKALPVPEEKRKARRGGKRVRRFKERFATTELRAQQNKIKVSIDEGEYGDSAMGNDQGMVGVKDSGKLRAPVKKQTKLLSRKQLKVVQQSSGQTNGLSSSLVFTPVQGIELVNPIAAAERVKEANNKWFNANSGFLSAVPK